MEQEIFRVNDFCVRFAISRTEFYRQVNANRLQIMKRGRRTYVTRGDAMDWVEKQRQKRDNPKSSIPASLATSAF